MPSLIDTVNEGALALRDVHQRYRNVPMPAATPAALSKAAPYFGYVDVKTGDCPPFVMFSNNDDYVAKEYFWQGADAYESTSLRIWTAIARHSVWVFDIGAYTGLYTLAAAKRNPKCKVHAFEALDIAYSRLLINKAANALGNIVPHHVALSNYIGSAEMHVYAGDSVLSSGSSLIELGNGRPLHHTKPVRCTKLDQLAVDLAIERLDLIKIDVEGAENLVFDGGMHLIEQYCPDILCEFLSGGDFGGIAEVLLKFGYTFYHIHEAECLLQRTDGIVTDDQFKNLNTFITKKRNKDLSDIFGKSLRVEG